jgi:hypothetical protein
VEPQRLRAVLKTSPGVESVTSSRWSHSGCVPCEKLRTALRPARALAAELSRWIESTHRGHSKVGAPASTNSSQSTAAVGHGRVSPSAQEGQSCYNFPAHFVHQSDYERKQRLNPGLFVANPA